MTQNAINRRNFLTKALVTGAAAVAVPAIITSCKEKKKTVEIPNFLDQAPDGPVLKAGLIGCGGRGKGAAKNFLDSGPNLKVVALGDVLEDRMLDAKQMLATEKGQEISDDMCFVGFDAFQKVIDAGVDVVLLATPPSFRPEHFAAAVQARKHVFMEKPVAVDPVGARSVMATGKKAEALGLSVVAGTQRRHQRDYVNTWKQVAEGGIGEITSANVYWNGGKLWHRDPRAEWSEMEYMIRDWVNWCWLSGDHIVEQHVHNLDVVNWFKGAHPIKAYGFGSRQRRVTGDQFDNFSIDFEFEDGMHMHSMCRQINGCTNNNSERIQGTKGSTNCRNRLYDLQGEIIWDHTYPLDENGEPQRKLMVDPYKQEHIDLVTAIRTSTPINEAENVATSTLVAIMGRISAYTGKSISWEEVMNSDLKLGPKVFAFGPVDIPKEVPIAGEAYQANS
jgi:predicted dehydrogenase